MTALCHGPGCRNPQTVPYWCSEVCKARWEARWGKRLPDEGPSGMLGAAFRAAADQAIVELALTTQMPQPGEPTTWDEVREQILRLAPAQPVEVAPVKLTREQFESIRAASPVYPEYARPSTFAGVPVVLVEALEESTPFQLACRDAGLPASTDAASVQVAPEDPQVAAERGWLSRVLGRMFGHRGEQQ